MFSVLSLLVSACASGSGGLGHPRARTPQEAETIAADEGLEAEIQEQRETTQERLDALAEARRNGTLGVIEPIARTPAPGWAGERIVDPTGDDWEPAVAADPSRPFVYILHNRSGGTPACSRGCPHTAMILHVSNDGGRRWRPERFLCECRGLGAQFDPIIEVVRETGDVYAVWLNGFHVSFSSSTDHGRTWSNPVWVHPDVHWGDKPNMAVSPDGQDVYILFNGPSYGDVHAAVSHDAGITWVTSTVTNSDRYYYDYGGIVLPTGRIVFGHVSFTYTGPHDSAEGVMDVHLIASNDAGATWTDRIVDEVQLDSPCTSRSCYLDFYDSGPVLAADEGGDLVMVYNGASEPYGPQTVYARSSVDGGLTWSEPVAISRPGVNAAFPAVVGLGDNEARLWFADQRTGRWNVWYTTTTDLGATWSTPVKLSDATSGTDYIDRHGFTEFYGDYGEIAITNTGKTIGVWGEGPSYYGPGGVWFNRER